MSQLPAKVEDVEYCDMLPSQATLYTSLVNKFSRQVRNSVTRFYAPTTFGGRVHVVFFLVKSQLCVQCKFGAVSLS